MVEYKIQLHADKINKLVDSLDILTTALRDSNKVQDKVKYWIQAAIVVLITVPVAILGIVSTVLGITNG